MKSLRYEGKESGVLSRVSVDLQSSWSWPTMSRFIPAIRRCVESSCLCR